MELLCLQERKFFAPSKTSGVLYETCFLGKGYTTKDLPYTPKLQPVPLYYTVSDRKGAFVSFSYTFLEKIVAFLHILTFGMKLINNITGA